MNVIIVPHPDDEWLFCSSFLYPNSEVIICSDDKKFKARAALSREFAEICKYNLHFLGFPDLLFSNYHQELITDIEDVLSSFSHISNLVIPCKTQHRDHYTLNSIMQEVLRPSNTKLNIQAVYEFLYWDRTLLPNYFKPVHSLKRNYVNKVDISESWKSFILTSDVYRGKLINSPHNCEGFIYYSGGFNG